MTFLFMFGMLLLILVAAEIFVNALEQLGDKLNISEGVTGSVFAAVGTALPETIVPLLAIFAGTSDKGVNEEIGVGAILGAPLMLSTLAMGLLAIATWRARGVKGAFTPEPTGLRRDLNVFLIAFALATVALYIPHEYELGRLAIGIGLVLLYFFYVMLTLRASSRLVEDGHGTEAEHELFLNRIGLPDHMIVVLLQIAIGLGVLVAAAKGFIMGISDASQMLGISPLLLSLVIVPVATELPEKINSILWIRRSKDTLAFGNLTGALVFQGTLLPAIGIMLTPWEPRREVLAGVVITFVGAAWLRLMAPRGIKVWHVTVNGGLYCTYLAIALG